MILETYLKKNQISTAKHSHVAGSTLHTAHFELHTAPAHEHEPVPACVHFILHNSNCDKTQIVTSLKVSQT